MPNEISDEEYLMECTVKRFSVAGIPYEPLDAVHGYWFPHFVTDEFILTGANLAVDGITDLQPIFLTTFRNGTNRNASLIKQLKDMPRIYKLKSFMVRDLCKAERYYDYGKGRWRWRPVLTEIKRLVPVKRNLTAILKKHRDRLTNDLSFSQVKFPLLGNITNVVFRIDYPGHINGGGPVPQRAVPSASIGLIANGSIFAMNAISDIPVTGNLFPFPAPSSFTINYGPYLPDTSKPVGWPGSYGNADGLFEEFAEAIEDSDVKCLTRLYTKVKNAKLDLATDIAELSQTIGLIESMAVNVGKTFLLLKKGNLLGALKNLAPTNRGEVSNVFLAFRYGVAPLMTDIQGAAEQLAERVLGLRQTMVRARKSRQISETLNYGNITITKSTSVDVKYKISYGFKGSETVSQLSRLGFTSPANVTWELVPFSFVIDWFLPIGNYLGSLSALDGYTVREIERTVFVKQSVFCDFHVPSTPVDYNLYPVTDLDFKWKCERVKMRREVIPSLPSLPLPRWRNPFTVGRALNALALLSQMFK